MARLVALLPAVLFGASCLSSRPPSPPPSAESRVEPLVLSLPTAPRDGSLPVAAIFPTVGRYALSGVQSMNGARLAVQDLNRAGGIRGRRLTLLEYPTGSYFLDARRAAELAAEAGALAIVGSNSSDLSMAIAEEAEARGIVQVSNVSTAQDLTRDPATGRGRGFIFRVCATDVLLGALLADFARERLGARRAAVLYEVGRTYSAKLARSFGDAFSDARAGRVVAEFFYLALETDFRGQLRRAATFRPDVLFLPGSFTDATLIALESRGLGLRATLLGADAWSSPLLFRRGGPEGTAYFADHCAPPDAFNGRYRDVFGQEVQGCRAALADDAVGTVAAGLSALGPLTDDALGRDLARTRQRLRDAVAAVDFRGQTGRVHFDAHGDRHHGVAVMAAEPGPDGRFAIRFHAWVGEP
jgi:branched-chain amino acid transport system substrate-binding protein